MFRLRQKGEEIVLHIANALLGVCLASAPRVLGFAGELAATWNAWITGLAIAFIALGSLYPLREEDEWLSRINLALGLWAILAPWLLGFMASQNAAYAHVSIGAIVALLSGFELWRIHRRSLSTA